MHTFKYIRNLTCLLVIAFSLMANTAQAQLEASIMMTTEADCNNVSVTFFLVHNDPNPIGTTSDGVDVYGIFGNIAFLFDETILSNPVLTDNFVSGTPDPLIFPTAPIGAGLGILDFGNTAVFIEHQFMAAVELFTITFDHNSSQECVDFSIFDQGQLTDIIRVPTPAAPTATPAIINTLEQDHECIPLCP